MVVYLGLDGGGTGCRAAACDETGAILGRGQAGPANIASDPEGACQNILAAAHQALAGVADPATVVAVLGLAGVNVAPSLAGLHAALPFARVRVETDALTALKGALHDDDGIVAALGTGSVFAVQRGGAVRMIGGWGFQLGDEASGAWMGRRLLAMVLRAADGFIRPSPLTSEVLAERGGGDAIAAFARSARPADFASFAPRILSAAEQGDSSAQAILAEAEAEVAAAVALLQEGASLPVAFLGGLGKVFAARLAGRWPIIEAKGSALDGALWLARQGGPNVDQRQQ